MKSYRENLDNYLKTQELSLIDLSELTDLDEETIVNNKNPYKFCVAADIDYTSLYSDTGFVTASIYSQYDKYPYYYKKIVTCKLLENLCTYTGSQDSLKKLLRSKLPESKMIISRAFSANSWFETSLLSKIEEAMSETISRDIFKETLAEAMFRYIPNYNYRTAKRVYGLTYRDVAPHLDMTPSAVSKWGMIKCGHITKSALPKLSSILGGFAVEEFITQFISEEQFRKNECKISLGSMLPDPPSDNELSNKAIEKEIENEGTDSKEDMLNVDTPVEPLDRTIYNTFNFTITDELMMKMFRKLDPTTQAEIKSEIAGYFFDELN